MQDIYDAVKRFLSGDKSAATLLIDAGFLNRGEPLTKGYVLYKALKYGLHVYSFIRNLNWDEFEEFIRYVFSEFGFNVAANVRLKCNGGAEFDIIAWNKEVAFVIEAKKWKGGGGKWAEVARKHLEKTAKCLDKLLAFSPSVVPVVISSTETSFISGGVPLVPVWKIGNFLSSFHDLKDHITILK
ncbi:NERD domain-containing protein [Pyrobaculum aerophilum]|uniref:NERD domain-containing protein n=2 Tax=Pyrobaculum aerophilum TaxID=13773 RepID=Q8ZYI2_PYRAE|nr:MULTISPECIES: NERD domain-containing protein [Pyrobaculum]AAL63011.1 hypothetical protein PAE0762 [Pyrobaculum aerophilum str. IM2]MCX8136206.1 NERD domain-containing protein [Pyrobaculum aerophilum]HII48218.1 hypothetical protein [Pyrobaculum aerophilum]